MKKNVLVFGLISGGIVSIFMLGSIAVYNSQNMEGSVWLGYTSMFLAFLLIFVGIKNYRDKYNQGSISFGKAFLMGLYMTLIASTLYVVVWMFYYYLFIPDYLDRYIDHAIQAMREKGASATEIQDKMDEMEGYKKLYETPIGVALMTYLEIVPVELVMSLLAGLILKRKAK